MRLLLLILALNLFHALGQSLTYNPGKSIFKNVSKSYYNTEYIFIYNSFSIDLELKFELIEQNLPQAWHRSGCTNQICYIDLPNEGSFGTVLPYQEAYFSVNLATNDTEGEGTIRYHIFSPTLPNLHDTIEFKYKVTEDVELQTQPWASVLYAQQVITVFIKSGSGPALLHLFDLSGNLIVQQTVEEIVSLSLNQLTNGIYIITVQNQYGNKLIKKIAVNR